MKTISTTVLICALLLAGACSNDQPAASSGATTAPQAASAQAQTAQLTPEQLGELGAQIRKNPADAQRLLAARGLDEQKFEQAVRKVSEDPAAAKRYSESYKKAGA
jgi:ABC-type enterochelin transport system substrate-binding protein